MARRKVRLRSVGELLHRYRRRTEEESTAALIRELREARRRGYLTPGELESVCRWKSARAIHHIKSNSPKFIRNATSRALSTRSERVRLAALTELKGVSIPMASAILMLLDPKRYGVIDIRVWQMLHRLGTVRRNPKGVGFTFAQWYQFLMIIRSFARSRGVTARDVERSLFLAHQDHQEGLLYGSKPGSRSRLS